MLIKLKTKAAAWAKGQRKKFTKSANFKALTMCGKCYTFYYRNSWHFEKPIEVEKLESYTVPVHFTQCPACMEQEVAQYNTDSGLPA